jgi:hypothetical protein
VRRYCAVLHLHPNGRFLFYFLARFEASPVHHTIWAHTQELCPNDQILQILSSAFFPSEGNCGKSRRSLLFFLTPSLIFEMPVLGGSAKRLWCLFFGAYGMVFFFSKK